MIPNEHVYVRDGIEDFLMNESKYSFAFFEAIAEQLSAHAVKLNYLL